MNPQAVNGHQPQTYGYAQPQQQQGYNYGKPVPQQGYAQPQHSTPYGNQNQYAQPQQQQQQGFKPAVTPMSPMGYTVQNPSKWTTRMTQHDDMVTCNECLAGCFCGPCALAYGKTRTDGSNCLVNCLCFAPCFNFQFIRLQYGIAGVCGDDCCYGLLCSCCTSRQALTETRFRGRQANASAYGNMSREWTYSLFDCSCCEMCDACCCTPCVAHRVHRHLQPQADSCCFDMFCMNPMGAYSQVRTSYGIITDFPCIEDVCVPLVCFPCALNRAQKEASLNPNPSKLSSR